MQNPYLTPTEQAALTMIAEGKSYRAIAQALALSPLTPKTVGLFMAKLRQRTGMVNTRDATFARDYLAAYAQSLQKSPTPDQIAIIEYIAHRGLPKRNIAELAPGKTEQEAWGIVRAAIQAAGIRAGENEWCRQCAIYLAHRNASKAAPKLSDAHKLALRLYSQGMAVCEINEHLPSGSPFMDAKRLIREGCDALGATSRGRGVQRRLLSIALAQMEQKPTQKDPLDGF